MSALTGRVTHKIDITSSNVEDLFERVEATLARGGLATVGTFTTDQFRTAAQRERLQASSGRGALAPVKDAKAPSYTPTGLLPGHAYTVWGVRRTNGRRELVLRDPYGDKKAIEGRPPTARARGIFTVSLEELSLLFSDLQLNG